MLYSEPNSPYHLHQSNITTRHPQNQACCQSLMEGMGDETVVSGGVRVHRRGRFTEGSIYAATKTWSVMLWGDFTVIRFFGGSPMLL